MAKVREWLGLSGDESGMLSGSAVHPPQDSGSVHADDEPLNPCTSVVTREMVDQVPFLTDVRERAVESFFGDRLYLGMLNILDGDPGLGKTMIALDVAARLVICDPFVAYLPPGASANNDQPRPKIEEAKAFLGAELAHGPVPEADIEKRAHRAKIADMTLKRAKWDLPIRSYQEGRRWIWEMREDPEDPEDG